MGLSEGKEMHLAFGVATWGGLWWPLISGRACFPISAQPLKLFLAQMSLVLVGHHGWLVSSLEF